MDASYDKIKKWKSLYKNIYKLVINDSIYIFRSLTILECEHVKYLIDRSTQLEIEDFVAESVVLYPHFLDINKEPAGNIAYLSKCAIELAGFFNRDTFLELLKNTKEAAESEFTKDFFLWKLAILQTFQGYTFEDLDKLSAFEFMKLVRICEMVKQENFVDVAGLSGPEIIDGDEVIDTPPQNILPVTENMYYSAFEEAAKAEPLKVKKKEEKNG